jgi:catalase
MRAQSFSAVCAILLLGPLAARAQDKPIGERLADVVQASNGGKVYPGYRINHAKGELFGGTFIPSADAKALSKASLFQGPPVPVLIRFSNAGGNPEAPDTAPSAAVRAMAMTFKAPDGNVDLMCISMPVFPVTNAEDFIALNKAAQASPPDTPKPTPIERFLAAHPAALKFVTTPKPMPVRHATQQYFAIHAYKFTNAAGEENYVRYHIIPEAGLAFVTAEDAAKRPPNVLLDELTDRLKTGPAKFRLEVQVAEPGDVVNDSTIAWPDSRRVVNLGEIDVTRPVPDSAEAEKKMGFLPTNVVAGIEPSDDPLFAARVAAYAVSYARRTQ